MTTPAWYVEWLKMLKTGDAVKHRKEGWNGQIVRTHGNIVYVKVKGVQTLMEVLEEELMLA